MASQVAQWWRIHLHAVQETQHTKLQSLGPEDPLEEEMATHSYILIWEIPWTEEPCSYSQSMVSQRVRLDWAGKHALTHSYMLCLLPSKKAHWKLEFHCDFLFNISILFHWPEIALENKLNFFYTLFCSFCQLCFFYLPKIFKIVWSVP